MKKTVMIVGMMLLGLFATSAQAAIIANFTGGNGSDSVDQYPGISGDGWGSAWVAATDSVNHGITSTVSNVTPLNGGGNYLSNVTTRTSGTANAVVRRQYTNFGGVDISGVHTISFDFRPETALSSGGGGNSRYQVFGSTAGDVGTTDSNTWVAMVGADGTGGIPADYVAGNWGFLDGGAGGIAGQGFVDSGITMSVGTVYHFEITVDPSSSTYVASISDGVNAFTTPSALSFRNGSATTGGEWLHFGRRSSSNLTFSVDSITIVPEPSAIVLIGSVAIVGAFGARRSNTRLRAARTRQPRSSSSTL